MTVCFHCCLPPPPTPRRLRRSAPPTTTWRRLLPRRGLRPQGPPRPTGGARPQRPLLGRARNQPQREKPRRQLFDAARALADDGLAGLPAVGIGLDDLIEAYMQTVLATAAIDRLAASWCRRGVAGFRYNLFRSLNPDAKLLAELMRPLSEFGVKKNNDDDRRPLSATPPPRTRRTRRLICWTWRTRPSGGSGRRS